MAEYNLFGFKFGTPDRPNENNADVKSFAPPENMDGAMELAPGCLLYTSPSPRDRTRSRMPSSA